MLSASWASTRLANLRRSGDVGDNDWTFGQVISLVLLAGPALSIAQLMYSCSLSPGMRSLCFPPIHGLLTDASMGQDRTQEYGNISAETCIQAGEFLNSCFGHRLNLTPCQTWCKVPSVRHVSRHPANVLSQDLISFHSKSLTPHFPGIGIDPLRIIHQHPY